jgi:hypothetical protein
MQLADCVQTKDVKVILSKAGSHFLDDEEDFYTMREALVDVVDHYFEYDLVRSCVPACLPAREGKGRE